MTTQQTDAGNSSSREVGQPSPRAIDTTLGDWGGNILNKARSWIIRATRKRGVETRSVRIFLSTVSDEFRDYRDQLRKDLTRHNVEVKVQEDFKNYGGSTLEKLDLYISHCDAVIHLVGCMTGALPASTSRQDLIAKYPDMRDRLPPLREAFDKDEPITFTQWEAWLALYHGKLLVVAEAEEGAPRGPKYVPTEESRAAQREHLKRLNALDRYGSSFNSPDNLTKIIFSSAILDLLIDAQYGGALSLIRKHPYRGLAAAVLIVVAVSWRFFNPPVAPINPPVKLDRNAIAVLPFHNLKSDPSIDYLSVSIPKALDMQLSQTSTLLVRPWDDVKQYANGNATIKNIAEALQVGTIIEGDLLSADQRLQVSVQIIDSQLDHQVWTESSSSVISQIEQTMGQLVRKIAGALGLSVAAAPGGPSNAQAYDLYLRTLFLQEETNDDSNQMAIAFLEQAVSLDPTFAIAHAELAQAYVTRFWWNFSNDPGLLDQAETSAQEALKLNATLPAAHIAFGRSLEGKGRRGEAMQQYFTALSNAPNFPAALENVARYAFYMGDFERSLATLKKMAAIDPLNDVLVRRAMCNFFQGRLDDSAHENLLAEKQAQGIDQLTLVAFTYVWLKDFDSAERVLQQLQQKDPTALSILEIQAWLATEKGQISEAQQLMKRILARRNTFGIWDEIATLYAIQGDAENAITWLTKAVDAGAPNYAWYNSDFFTVLRGDPRHSAILKQLADEYAAVRK
jgi:TolB-like protein/Flp pilus assembly protein TadD